ncbi:hypothetical protein [Citrobacter freundii]|uniref:hypothetical protein n=1 Tax=Citrobacter freundii TaxID=546 RepID=UPI001EF13EDB|nr:hypothetical protein [Citrobacter freundii]
MKGFWCDRRDNYPVFNISVREDSKDVNKIYIEFAEPVKGYEKQWRRAARAGDDFLLAWEIPPLWGNWRD